MPLTSRRNLPSLSVLRSEGIDVRGSYEADPVKIGLLNLMPDSAFEATERQWLRLCAQCDEVTTSVFPFTFLETHRSESIRHHIDQFYETWQSIKVLKPDLLIVTGANPKTSEIASESFWTPMIETVRWADERDCPIVCSCLATHAVTKEFYGVDRVRLPEKCWGVFEHQCLQPDHPLIRGIDSAWLGPHSHVYGVTRQQLEAVGIQVLVDSVDAGVYAAASGNFPRFIFLQGHPEYDANSLLKEFKREVARYLAGDISSFPRPPQNYFSSEAKDVIDTYRQSLSDIHDQDTSLRHFPESFLQSRLASPWQSTGVKLFNNLLRKVQDGR